METRTETREGTARMLMAVSLFCGLFGVAAQFFPGMEFLALFAGVPVLGGLAASSRMFDEREQQLLNHAFGVAFQWTGIGLFFFFALYESLRWLTIGEALIQFSNGHWIGLVFSLMMLLLGVAGLQAFRETV